jgi:hypothetical protein
MLLGLHFRAPQYRAPLSPGPSSTPDVPPSESFTSTTMDDGIDTLTLFQSLHSHCIGLASLKMYQLQNGCIFVENMPIITWIGHNRSPCFFPCTFNWNRLRSMSVLSLVEHYVVILKL